MIALIYAAGTSLRIKKTINIEHKSLLTVKNKKLIEHQLTWIKKSNAKKIIIKISRVIHWDVIIFNFSFSLGCDPMTTFMNKNKE